MTLLMAFCDYLGNSVKVSAYFATINYMLEECLCVFFSYFILLLSFVGMIGFSISP